MTAGSVAWRIPSVAELTDVLPRTAVAQRPSIRRALAATAAGTIVALVAAGLVFEVLNGGAAGPNGRDYTLGTLIAGASFGLPGGLLTARRAAWPVGPLALFIGFGLALSS